MSSLIDASAICCLSPYISSSRHDLVAGHRLMTASVTGASKYSAHVCVDLVHRRLRLKRDAASVRVKYAQAAGTDETIAFRRFSIFRAKTKSKVAHPTRYICTEMRISAAIPAPLSRKRKIPRVALAMRDVFQKLASCARFPPGWDGSHLPVLILVHSRFINRVVLGSWALMV